MKPECDGLQVVQIAQESQIFFDQNIVDVLRQNVRAEGFGHPNFVPAAVQRIPRGEIAIAATRSTGAKRILKGTVLAQSKYDFCEWLARKRDERNRSERGDHLPVGFAR